MQQNRKRRRIRSQNNDLADTAVESLGRFVGALFQLAVVRGLLHEVEDFLREGLVGDGPGRGFVGHVELCVVRVLADVDEGDRDGGECERLARCRRVHGLVLENRERCECVELFSECRSLARALGPRLGKIEAGPSP